MNTTKFIFSFIISSATIFGVVSYFQLPYQIYIWELFIDFKVLSLVVLIGILYKKDKLIFTKTQFYPRAWLWKSNVICFFIPVLVYALILLVGMLFNTVELNKNDNALTLILATLFDIPAIYIFSITTVYIEEIFFRSFLVTYLMEKKSFLFSLILSSFFWTLYNVSEILSLQGLNFFIVLILLLYFLAIGSFTILLFKKYNSILPGYSFRIGMVTLSPLIITSFITESESFFSTDSSIFFVEGILFSTFLLAVSFILYTKIRSNNEILTL